MEFGDDRFWQIEDAIQALEKTGWKSGKKGWSGLDFQVDLEVAGTEGDLTQFRNCCSEIAAELKKRKILRKVTGEEIEEWWRLGRDKYEADLSLEELENLFDDS